MTQHKSQSASTFLSYLAPESQNCTAGKGLRAQSEHERKRSEREASECARLPVYVCRCRGTRKESLHASEAHEIVALKSYAGIEA